jgi:hypothetical protein
VCTILLTSSATQSLSQKKGWRPCSMVMILQSLVGDGMAPSLVPVSSGRLVPGTEGE